MSNILSKFSTHYQKILAWASSYAQSSGRNIIELGDILLALASERGSLAAEILERQGLNPIVLNEKLGANPVSLLPSTKGPSGDFKNLLAKLLSTSVKKVVERSVVIAWKYNHHYVGTEHLLQALAEEESDEAKSLWQKLNVDVASLKASVLSVLKSTSKFPDITEAFSMPETKVDEQGRSELQALDYFGTNLTSHEVQSKIDPVIGREKEITRVINILARRTKNNPLLLGDPGVGKTAIVEGLAKRIIEGKVPDWLIGKKIYALDLGLLVAGTMYRGEFENRLKQIVDELKTNPDIILFIDEIHTIVGTGAAPGSLDLANLIKPALAKGHIRCIGATTQEEFKKSIESDPALERRFQTVTVREISPLETEEVLKGIKSNYEKFHGVKIGDDVIEAAVYLSERYLPEKFLPDKAIDLIDEAASHARTNIKPSPELRHIKELEQKSKQLSEAKEIAIGEENFVLATEYKNEEEKVAQEIHKLKNSFDKINKPSYALTRADIAQVISQMTGVPINDLLDSEKTKLADLEKIITKRLKGQDEAVNTVAKFIRRGRLGIGGTQRPIGSFMFLGPSGVGKTELAKIIAEEVFGDANALIRIDMSEFSEAFNVSKLIGAPAGYIGYKDSNKLSDQVKRRPSSVVLFDEIEKAHPDIYNLLLQILDEGYLTDAAGKQINFKNCLIILTSNIGLRELNEQASLGFEAEDSSAQEKFASSWMKTKNSILEEVKKFFRPEFLNRLDATVVFNPLVEKDLEDIVKLQIAQLESRLDKQKIKVNIKIPAAAIKMIARTCFSPREGARGIRRFIQEKIENHISDKLLAQGKEKTITVNVVIKNNEVVIE